MKPKYSAFTLIELIVWITISMILMISVGLFMSSWMQNILKQQKVLENTDKFTDFSNNLHTSFNLIQSWSFAPVDTASWIIFKRWQNYWEGGFSYIWTEILDLVYCESDSEDSQTNNIFLKNFIPFEENWENIFNNYEEVLTWTTPLYISYQKEHIIKDSSWNIIIWKWIYWDKFEEWVSWTEVYLNSPTWLAMSWNILFVSDTLNNRVLYYDIINDKIYKLLDKTDWLNEPTGLYYNDSSLYISNSGNWEILKYSSKSKIESTLTLTWITQNSINKINVEFFNNNWNSQNISWPSKSDITVPWSSNDFSEINSNIITYYIINYAWTDISINDCIWESWNEILSWWNPVSCTSSWTWQLSNNVNTNFNNSEIIINNIANLSNTWSYYVNLKLFNWTTEEYSNFFPYFTQSDNNLITKNDNTLEVLYSWLNYPTWIWWIWNSDFNEFWDWTYWNLPYHSTDSLLETPIKSLNISNTPNDLISLILKYYKRYNCYNLDDKIERTFLLNKNLK